MTITRRLAAIAAAAALALVGAVGLAANANAVDGTMTVDPSTIVAGGSTTVSGTGCTPLREIPSEVTITVSLVGTAGGPPAATAGAAPDGQGNWSVAIAVKEAGAYTVRATCAQYLVEPSDYPAQPLTVTEAPPTTATTTSESPTTATTTSESPTTATTTSESPTTSESTTTSEPTTTQAPTTTAEPTSSATAESTSSATVVSSASETASATASTTKSTAPPELTLVNFTGEVEQGGSIGIDATGFQPGENVTVTLHSDPVLLTTLIADDGGRASGTVTVPLDTAVGPHTITVVGELSGISLEAPITVVAAVETTVAQPSTAEVTSTAEPVVVTSTSDLANTGVNAAAMTIWGVVLLVAGGIAVALARKRDGKHAGD